MRYPALLKNIILLAVLLTVIGLPPLVSGQHTLSRAQAAEEQGDPASAARLYELAALHLPWRPGLWQDAGLSAFSAGQMEESIRLLSQAGECRALDVRGATALGQALWQTGDWQAAMTVWQAALSDSNPDPDLLSQLVEAHHTLGDYPAERAVLEKLLSIRPQDAWAHYRLGLLLAVGQPRQSLLELMEAARLDPALEPAVQVMRKALNTALLVDEPAYQLTVAGQGLAGLNEWALAGQAFAEAVRARPDYAEAWAWLGEARQQLGQDGAVELSRAALLGPDSALVHVLRGLRWQRQGQPDLALEHFRTAALLEPENPAWQTALADAYVQAGSLPPALSAYQRAVELAPQDAQNWRRLADFCIREQYQIVEIGLPAAYRALELAPDDAMVLDTLGWLYMELNDPLVAEKYLQQAVSADPALASAYLHLGILHLQTNRPDLARAELVRARDLGAGKPLGEQAQMLLEQHFP